MIFNKLQKRVLGFAIGFLIFLFAVGTVEVGIYNNQMARTEMLDSILDIEGMEDFEIMDTKLNLNVYDLLGQIDHVLANDF